MRGFSTPRLAALALMAVLVAACHEDPPPPNGGGPRLPPEQLQAEIDALAQQDSVAAALRRDALLQLQAGKAEAETLEIHLYYSGNIEPAERDFPGYLFAGPGDYLHAFELGIIEDLGKATGLKTQVFHTTLSELRAAKQPCVNLAWGARELLTVDTPEGARPSMIFSYSLMATFMHDPALALRREIEFFQSPQDHVWVEGENIGRMIYEQPTLRARRTVSEWLGEIQPTTPR
jgi:hypothetical protein